MNEGGGTDPAGSQGTDFRCFDRYDDVATILKDRRTGAPLPPHAALRLLRRVGLRRMADAVEFGFVSLLNGADHSRLRSIVEPYFHNRAIVALEPRIEEVAGELLDKAGGVPVFDLVTVVGAQLPTRVVSEIYGFPRGDVERLNTWAHQLAPLGDQELHWSSPVTGLIAFHRFRRRILEVVRERQRAPRGDLLSAMGAAIAADPVITEDHIVGLAILTFTAGHTTTSHLIGSSALVLFSDPELVAEARQSPEVIERIVDETLRLYSPVQRVARIALEDIDLNGETIPKGTRMRLMVGKANRDDRRFPDAEAFLPDRPTGHNLAFVAGPHHCFGFHLARLEAKAVLQALLDRYPHIEIAEDALAWRKGTKFLGLSRLRLKVG